MKRRISSVIYFDLDCNCFSQRADSCRATGRRKILAQDSNDDHSNPYLNDSMETNAVVDMRPPVGDLLGER